MTGVKCLQWMYSVQLVNIFTEYMNITCEMLAVKLLYIFLPKTCNSMWDELFQFFLKNDKIL